MIFRETPLAGAYVVDIEPRADDRGFFARAWCARELEQQGLSAYVAQVNLSQNQRKGTLRGMHYQVAPHEEVKLVRCIRGALYDVIIDLRSGSPTRGHWFGVELTAANRLMLYVPAGFAHGFQALADDTEALYQVSEFYTPGAERGVRHDDPAFAIRWPLPVTAISDKDASWPDYTEAADDAEAGR
jgi:dTDP-4-dehydrorhamnose 3,5-epimerase